MTMKGPKAEGSWGDPTECATFAALAAPRLALAQISDDVAAVKRF